MPHCPQLVTAASDASQPSLTTPLQLALPGGQIRPQTPPKQTTVDEGSLEDGHSIWQLPQRPTFVSRLVSQPLATFPSQDS